MAFNVWANVPFTDARGMVRNSRYLLEQTLATDGSDMADVLTAVGALETALKELTWCAVGPTQIEIDFGSTPGTPNVASDDSVYAFIRVADANENEDSLRVPGPDMVLYNYNEDGILGTVWQAAVDLVLTPKVRMPSNGASIDDQEYSQVKYMKRRKSLD